MDQTDQKLVQLERKLFDLSSLLQAGKAFDNLLGVRELYNVFTGIVQERFGVETFALFIMDDDRTRFEMVQGLGLSGELPADFSFPADEGLLWQAIRQGQPFATVDSLGESRFTVPFERYRLSGLLSRYFVPLVHRGKVVGLLSVGTKKNGNSYTDNDLEFCTFCRAGVGEQSLRQAL